jgi:crotonobetainyl-CoA:carnitine CoA-transferase CaiB-like acyl-CoA transferase
MSKPFAGVRILDFTQVFAGPFCSFQLALMGADIIMIEKSGGEGSRTSVISKEWSERQMAPAWQATHANKRAITLDLKNPKAIEVVNKLAETADVVLENFRPGVMDRLGIGYKALSAINPKLIYCAMTGFGQEGPEANTRAYDGKIQALTGVMSVTGHPEMGPTRAGFAICDALTGMTGAYAVASALFQRTHTGQGQFVDVAMYDSTLSFMSPAICDWTIAGHRQRQYGNQAISRQPTANLFKCKDGWILLAVNRDNQFVALMTEIGRADVVEDPRFKEIGPRTDNEALLREIIEDALAAETAEVWEKRLNAVGAPAARPRTLEEAVNMPQLAYREVLQTYDTPYGKQTIIGSGIKMAHDGPGVDRPPPGVGEHIDEVLQAAGYSADDIATMRNDNVF